MFSKYLRFCSGGNNRTNSYRRVRWCANKAASTDCTAARWPPVSGPWRLSETVTKLSLSGCPPRPRRFGVGGAERARRGRRQGRLRAGVASSEGQSRGSRAIPRRPRGYQTTIARARARAIENIIVYTKNDDHKMPVIIVYCLLFIVYYCLLLFIRQKFLRKKRFVVSRNVIFWKTYKNKPRSVQEKRVQTIKIVA